MKARSVDSLYKEMAEHTQSDISALLPEGISKEVGHFNVFNTADLYNKFKAENKVTMPYERRLY